MGVGVAEGTQRTWLLCCNYSNWATSLDRKKLNHIRNSVILKRGEMSIVFLQSSTRTWANQCGQLVLGFYSIGLTSCFVFLQQPVR